MDLLDRMHARLRAALDRAQAESPGATTTVADVYQRLIPYRAIRGELGIMELAEYEHALLRLLTGERDYLTIASDAARAELRTELASPNPILGVYRDYSGLPVRLLAGAPAGTAGDAVRGDPACGACGAAMREEWNFCVRCGTPRPGVAPRT